MRRLLLSLLGLAVLGGTIAAVAATTSAAAKPGLTVQIAPASQSITRGQSASYAVTVSPTGGFTGTVTLSASGLPSGSSATFTPGSLTFRTTAGASSSLVIATGSSTIVGKSSFTVTATSGKVSGNVTGGLTVNAPITSSLGMAASPGSVSLSPGSVAVYTVTLTRTNVSGPVTLSVGNALPSGVTAAFAPNPVSGTSTSLQVNTKTSTPTGTYTLNLVASGVGVNNGKVYAYVSVTLAVTKQGKVFTISGNLAGALAPGVSLPLNLTLSNPNNQRLAVGNLTVTVKSVTKAVGAPGGTCSTSDYAVTQYSGPYPLSVPANGSATLSTLVTDRTKWPQVRMLNAAYNQDGCKGATVTLAYSGSGSGS